MRDIDVPLNVAVVGAGPAGIYACESLLRGADAAERAISVDLIERLPVPFGLLRFGVAPDHPRIKGIARVLSQIVAEPRVRFLGGVEVGHDVTVAELRERYDAVLLATGALTDRRLTIDGADAAGVYGAAEFVTWYDGHPDADPDWDLSAGRAAVVGVGNVALDVARMLLRTPDELEPTDIPESVRQAFAGNQANHVTILGRRGPWQARFTPKELRELDHIDRVQVIVDPADLVPTEADQELRAAERHVEQNLTKLEEWAAASPDPDVAEAAALAAGDRVLRFRFQAPPERVLTADGRVSGLEIGGPRPATVELEAIYTAIGYRSKAIPEVEFDDDSATIPNLDGRVTAAGAAVPGLYVTGWIKRGPTGVIGTNRSCASATVDAFWADLDAGRLPEPTGEPGLRELLDSRGVHSVDGAGWQAISDHEEQLGAAGGRERTKVAVREELLAIAREAQSVSSGSVSG